MFNIEAMFNVEVNYIRSRRKITTLETSFVLKQLHDDIVITSRKLAVTV